MRKLLAVLLSLCLLVLHLCVGSAEADGAYVLMNIPYEQFYAAEVTDATMLDAVTSATLMKPRTGKLAAGSYHVDPEGTDVTGVIFPVYVEDTAVLAELGGVEITDDSIVDITVTNKGEETTTTYAGKDALFEAPSYSWYVLDEEPALYKPLDSVEGPVFREIEGAINAEEVEATASIVYDRHADIVIKIEGLAEALGEETPVSGVILVADDGTRVGLRHLANLWRQAQIGMNLGSEVYAALRGKTITEIEYITQGGIYSVKADLPVLEDELLIGLAGTYIELFPEFAREEYKDYWMECIKAYDVDDDAAEAYYAMLTGMFMGRLYGQEAIEAYGSDPQSMLFDCFFENEIAKLTISGRTISGTYAEGTEMFRHDYAYVRDEVVTYFGEEMPATLHIYKTDDADAGKFTYFAFSDDTPAATQHIEFRYGETDEAIGSYTEGDYAYWLAGGILDGYKESMIKDCIKLFVDENVGEEQEEVAGEAAEPVAAVEIATAEELAAINDDLSGSYVLTADIDLGGAEWTPIGAYAPSGESEEEQEIPSSDLAFTGTFDGNGHTISNFVIDQPEGMAEGLFGCVANAEIKNLTVENASVGCMLMASDVVGYAFSSTISNVTLKSGKVTAYSGEMSGEGMYGGIVGAGMNSLIEGCSAEAEIVVPDDTANAGIVGGGLELTSLVDCTATGSITAGANCYGLGGVSGCGFGAKEFTNCSAKDVTITAGEGAFWIGGITGYAGGYADESFGVPVTVFTGCTARNVTVNVPEDSEGVSEIVGAGFYSEQVAQAMGEPFDKPTEYELVDCVAED